MSPKFFGDKLVGTVSYSDYPERAKSITRIGNFQSWSLESLVALQPDLVLRWGSGNGMDTLATFERLGIPVFNWPRCSNSTDVAERLQARCLPCSLRRRPSDNRYFPDIQPA